jgi:MerR family transcriptional regulator, light-induced transcriptional regulator
MAIYAIRDLERLTGIKAGTIRIWEQRYRLIEPKRTPTNIRYYNDEDLRMLMNVALLNKNGYKISKIAEMTPTFIAQMATEIAASDVSRPAQIDALILAMIDLDEEAFEAILGAHVRETSFEQAMLELVYPFLDKLSVLWITRSISPAHEKFVTNLIRRKLMAAIDQASFGVSDSSNTFLLYSPEGEQQELTLLFIQYILRTRQQRVVYLGLNTTLGELRDVCEPLKPKYVFTILQDPPARQSLQGFLDTTARSVNGSELLLTGTQFFASPVSLPTNARLLNGLGDLMHLLDNA